MGDDAPATPKRGGLFGNFGAMLESGGFMAAVGAVLKGHSMTEEQAVLLVQSHWRRHAVYVDNRTRQLAARHIQCVYMEREERRNRANMEALMSKEHERQTQAAARTRAATKINMTWRGHLARNRARQLRRQKEGFGSVVRRSLSFGKKKGSARAVGSTLPAMPEAPPPSPGGGGGTATRVMRSLSFGKKSSSSSSSSSSSKDGKPAMVAVSATRRTFVLERGPQGLGLELDSTNTIITVKPGGRAEQQGLVQLDDVILSVDGKSCTGKLMQEVMVPGRPVYVVEILRQEKKEAPVATPMKAMNAIRRSMSFDKKPSGGSVKRTMSWTTKKFG